MKDSNAVVVGGGHGIGRAAAIKLAGAGARVVVSDVDIVAAQAVAQEIGQGGGRASSAEVDVGDPASVARFAASTLSMLDRLDVLVSTAGVAPKASVVEMGDDVWRRTQSINLDGAFYLSREFAPAMIEKRSGTMVFVASDRALFGQERGSAYASSKAGLIAFVKSLALELGPHGVTANVINPGTTDTRMVQSAGQDLIRKRMAEDPLGQLSQPDDIAEIIFFLAATAGKFMTGQLVTTRMRFG
jgi:NAD(P)-dependent dehydrogenase (short-subunit alcohol dehydrogenase family)